MLSNHYHASKNKNATGKKLKASSQNMEVVCREEINKQITNKNEKKKTIFIDSNKYNIIIII